MREDESHKESQTQLSRSVIRSSKISSQFLLFFEQEVEISHALTIQLPAIVQYGIGGDFIPLAYDQKHIDTHTQAVKVGVIYNLNTEGQCLDLGQLGSVFQGIHFKPGNQATGRPGLNPHGHPQ